MGSKAGSCEPGASSWSGILLPNHVRPVCCTLLLGALDPMLLLGYLSGMHGLHAMLLGFLGYLRVPPAGSETGLQPVSRAFTAVERCCDSFVLPGVMCHVRTGTARARYTSAAHDGPSTWTTCRGCVQSWIHTRSHVLAAQPAPAASLHLHHWAQTLPSQVNTPTFEDLQNIHVQSVGFALLSWDSPAETTFCPCGKWDMSQNNA